jgi:hypothetical protein
MLNRIAAAYENESQPYHGHDVAAGTHHDSVLGLVVGFIVVSILIPIFEMNQLVR